MIIIRHMIELGRIFTRSNNGAGLVLDKLNQRGLAINALEPIESPLGFAVIAQAKINLNKPVKQNRTGVINFQCLHQFRLGGFLPLVAFRDRRQQPDFVG